MMKPLKIVAIELLVDYACKQILALRGEQNRQRCLGYLMSALVDLAAASCGGMLDDDEAHEVCEALHDCLITQLEKLNARRLARN